MATNVLYSPYGSFELKAKYQRNFALSTTATLAFVLLILAVAWIISSLGKEEAINAPQVIIRTVADLGPPPSIAKKPPQVKVSAPQVVAPKVGIPKPVADDEVLDEDVVIATKDEMAEIVAPDITAMSEGGNIAVEIDPDDYLPAPDEFIPLEIRPEMIYQHTPEYPRLAKDAGITGTTWVNVLLNEEGSVMDAIIAKSSGTTSLDDAALQAARKCKFKPGIQNGRPVKCWVTFPIEFKLDQ